ncbi:50S ribosomal protein L20P [Ectocarpus siliculosus]|uniref:50S ribosomal protein L20 n=1 Tax=Ectocarpus siliculosus TaxID=2880 RepID=D7G284_ECTSI|nr:50S ribosomal protein L20P [Ectocarpus siliculosus]|eukprot:CBJ48761.1 50S ribosomal protein L20P [Ectocarpus siliculosus]
MAANNHRHKKILKLAKGYRGRSKSVFKIAIQRVEKALQQAYRDRKNKKREFRRLWIERINAGVRQHGMPYSVFVNKARKADVELNRKVLAEMAVTEPYSFRAVVETVKAKGSPKA